MSPRATRPVSGRGGRRRTVRVDERSLVAAVDGKVAGALRVAGLPVTAEDCLELAHAVSLARQARDLPRDRRDGRPREKARAFLAWKVSLWTATKTSDGKPDWQAVAAFMRTTGLDDTRDNLVDAGRRYRQLVRRMLRDVAKESGLTPGRNSVCK